VNWRYDIHQECLQFNTSRDAAGVKGCYSAEVHSLVSANGSFPYVLLSQTCCKYHLNTIGHCK